jgi:hypothetical protein
MSRKPCPKPPQKPACVKQRKTRPQGKPPRDTFQVVILCTGEEEQERLYEEFRSRNFQVRLLTM